MHEQPQPGSNVLATELERITSGAHEFAEIRLLNALRAGSVKVKAQEAAEMERLLGAEGNPLHTRLDLPPDAEVSEFRRALQNAIGRWQRGHGLLETCFLTQDLAKSIQEDAP